MWTEKEKEVFCIIQKYYSHFTIFAVIKLTGFVIHWNVRRWEKNQFQ